MPSPTVIVCADAPSALVRVCGISLLERLLRTLERAGVRRALVLTATAPEIRAALAPPSWARARVEIDIRERPAGPLAAPEALAQLAPGADRALVLPGGLLLDGRLVAALLAQEGSVRLVDSAPPPGHAPLLAGVPRERGVLLCGPYVAAASAPGAAADLDVAALPDYIPGMRRRLRPIWFPAPAPEQRGLAESVVLDSAQKAALDLPAHVHAPIENFLVSLVCRTSITPNQLSLLSNLVAWSATFLFATGRLLPGTLLALLVGVLDGVDGKQARVKVETTPAGKLEHWFDGLFEGSWILALTWHFAHAGLGPRAFAMFLVFALGEALSGVGKYLVLRTRGMQIDDLGPRERAVRLLAGRRNVYLWLFAAGVFAGAPERSFALLPWWAAATALWYLPRGAREAWSRRRS